MNNLNFFKECFAKEMRATSDVLNALIQEEMHYKPHENSRSAYEIAEHILAHAGDFETVLTKDVCDELLVHPFKSPSDAALSLENYWNQTISLLGTLDESSWNNEPVDFLIEGQLFASMNRSSLMWMYLFDIIHHRGQLTTYIRPMGGKNPAVYGYSYDTLNA